MTDKTLVYIKQSGGLAIPVTVRIEWLENGKIIPRMYWTPDGSRYQVKHVYETTPMAFLKDRGEGLRFKIRAVLVETPEYYPDHQFTQHETYLYLADNFFYGKNIIDGRYGHAGKVFIPVSLDVFPNAEYELICFKVQEQQYEVESTIAVEPRGSFYAGGIGIWHKVKARHVNPENETPDHSESTRISALFFEINKWFVVKAA